MASLTRVDFVMGMPRSGSTWLASQLDALPDVAVFGETSFFGRHHVPALDGSYGAEQVEAVRRIQRARSWTATTGVPGVAMDGEPWEYLVDAVAQAARAPIAPASLFLALAQAVGDAQQARRLVEKTPHHVRFADRIAQAFPDSRLVITRREPYGFVRSLHHLGERKGDLSAAARWDELTRHPMLCAWMWRQYATAIDAVVQRHGSRTLVLDLARIQREPAAVLADVAAFLDLPAPPPSASDATNSSFRGAPPPVSADEVFWVNSLLRSYLGPGRRPLPRPRRAVLRSLATAPLSVLAAASSMKGVPGAARYLQGILR